MCCINDKEGRAPHKFLNPGHQLPGYANGRLEQKISEPIMAETKGDWEMVPQVGGGGRPMLHTSHQYLGNALYKVYVQKRSSGNISGYGSEIQGQVSAYETNYITL